MRLIICKIFSLEISPGGYGQIGEIKVRAAMAGLGSTGLPHVVVFPFPHARTGLNTI